MSYSKVDKGAQGYGTGAAERPTKWGTPTNRALSEKKRGTYKWKPESETYNVKTLIYTLTL